MSVRFVFNPLSGNFDEISEISLSAVGSSPNANAATLTNQALNLEPASGSFPGVVTTGTQTFAGTKTFSSTISGSINGNAATVTTNANLTGDVTSSGNATTYANVVPAALIPTYSWTGYHDLSVVNWYFNTTAYTDPTSQDANGNAINEVDNNGFGTVASLVNGSAKYPGFTFTNPVAGRYRVSASIPAPVGPSAGQFLSLRLTDGTTVIDETQHIGVFNEGGTLQGIIYWSTSTSRTIKIQGAASATTGIISNTAGPVAAMVRWAIEKI